MLYRFCVLIPCAALTALLTALSGPTTAAHPKVAPDTRHTIQTVTTAQRPVRMETTTTLTPTTTTTVVKHQNAGVRHILASRPSYRTPATPDYHTFPDWPLWHCIGIHEQAGGPPDGISWHGSAAGGLPDSGYPGGLGISREAWADARGAAGVSVTNGAYATPPQQIFVARVILRRHGLSAWATASICRRYL